MAPLTTSELARQGGVNLESIRFYERERLLPKPPRTAGGYRMFTPDDVRRVRFIKRAQELGFSLREIKELLALRFEPDTSCANVRERAENKLSDIDQKISDLKRMRKALARLVDACPGRGNTSECPILESLDSPNPVLRFKTYEELDDDAKPSAMSSVTIRAAKITPSSCGMWGIFEVNLAALRRQE